MNNSLIGKTIDRQCALVLIRIEMSHLTKHTHRHHNSHTYTELHTRARLMWSLLLHLRVLQSSERK